MHVGRAAWSSSLAKFKFTRREAGQVSLCRGCRKSREQGEGISQWPGDCAKGPLPLPCSLPDPAPRDLLVLLPNLVGKPFLWSK